MTFKLLIWMESMCNRMMNNVNRLKAGYDSCRRGLSIGHLSWQPTDHCSVHPARKPDRSHCCEGHFMEKKKKVFHGRKLKACTSFSCSYIMLQWMTYTINTVQYSVAPAAPSRTIWMGRPGARPFVLRCELDDGLRGDWAHPGRSGLSVNETASAWE